MCRSLPKNQSALDTPGSRARTNVREARGMVGPPLTNIASRVYLAGRLPNTPANMERWIQQPHAIDDKTAMPETGVTDADARDIAAYLYTLR